MSERSRQRWLYIHNRLEELRAKYGEPDEQQLPDYLDHADMDPSWGPLGSLLQAFDPAEYQRLVEADAEVIGRRRAAPTPAESWLFEPPQNRVLEASEGSVEPPPGTRLNEI